jgi:hypothetical protein
MAVPFYQTTQRHIPLDNGQPATVFIYSIQKLDSYILLTVHLDMILGKWPTWRTILFYVFISILYVFQATSCSSSGDSIVSIHHLVYVTLCRWPFCVQVSHQHTKRSRGCSKHVQNWNKHTNNLCLKLVIYQESEVRRFDLTPRHEFRIVWVTGTNYERVGWVGVDWHEVLLNVTQWTVHPTGKSLDCCRPKRLWRDNCFLPELHLHLLHRLVKLMEINYFQSQNFQKRYQLINPPDDLQQTNANFPRYFGINKLPAIFCPTTRVCIAF